jgi:proline dehydrogenase
MEDRWSLPDLTSALGWCRDRAGQGIRCTVTGMAEFARTSAESVLVTRAQLEGIRAFGAAVPGVSWAVKPSSIGILIDPAAFETNLAAIAQEAQEQGVPLEIDMEGRPLVEGTLRSALNLAEGGSAVTLALQVYLDRTPRDLDTCLRAGIRVRLVKGAYLGDTSNFAVVQQRFQALATILTAAGVPFSAATHDPELIDWLQKEIAGHRGMFEFAFLKGLADRTKVNLVAEGWKVAEYVPYGPGGDAYRQRRLRYLQMLGGLRRAPAS